MDYKIVFSKHAQYQMRERNISEVMVFRTLVNPDKVVAQGNQKFQAIKAIKSEGSDYLVVVIYRKINSSKKVITVFLTSKIRKYLNE